MSHDISMSAALDRQPESLASAVRALSEQLTGSWPAPRRPLFVAMGASHAALAACVHQLRAYGIWASRAGYGEIPAPVPAADVDLVAGVSQSGRSAETIDAVREVDAARRLAVVNIAESPLAQLAGNVLSCGGVPDSKVSTAGFTVTLAALGMLADTWALGAPGEVWQSLADRLDETGKRAGEAVDVLVEGVAESVAADVVGAGASLTAAEEGALMLREACRLPATAYETRQYLHGPMESAGRTAHIVVGDEREAALALQLAEAGHRVLYVGPCATPVPHVEIPRLAPVARAIVENAVLQRLVVEVAAARGVPVGEFVFSMDDTKVDTLAAEGA